MPRRSIFSREGRNPSYVVWLGISDVTEWEGGGMGLGDGTGNASEKRTYVPEYCDDSTDWRMGEGGSKLMCQMHGRQD